MLKVLVFKVGDLQTNCCLVYCEESKEAVVIDIGATDKRVNEAITEKGLTLKYILLTHGHFDHIMGVKNLKETFGAPVLIHKHDAECLYNPAVSLAGNLKGVDEYLLHADVEFDDKAEFELGQYKISVMHTKGHTKGSCCFIIGDNLFSGDTLFRDGVGRTDLYGGNFNELKSSLEKLKKLTKDYKVYPGHEATTTLFRELRGDYGG